MFRSPEVLVFAAERPRSERVQPTLSHPKQIIRNLWLAKYTEQLSVFQKGGGQVITFFSLNPIPNYPEFAEDLKAEIDKPIDRENQADICLPGSAEPFEILNRHGRKRKIPSFRTQLRRKIASDFPWQKKFSVYSYGPDVPFSHEYKDQLFVLIDQVARGDVELFQDGLDAYNSVDDELLNLLEESVDRIRQLPPLNRGENPLQKSLNFLKKPKSHKDPEVYHGRDAKWLFLARKAQMLGLQERNLLRYIISSRNILDFNRFSDYVLSQNIPPHAYHFDDAASTGHGIKAVLEVLAESENRQLTERDFLEQAKFITAPHLPREVRLFPEKDSTEFFDFVVKMIEARILGERPNTFRVYRNGNLEPDFNPGTGEAYSEYLKFWAVEQAIVRHFLPKVPKY